jgi:hypothetical protein
MSETTSATECGCCGNATIPPTPGTDEVGYYCETCGIAWASPADREPGSCWWHKQEAAQLGGIDLPLEPTNPDVA